MIGSLSGRLRTKLEDGLLLEVAGVGYLVKTSPGFRESLTPGQKLELEISAHIKDDRFDLYGFSDLVSKQLFELFLSVTGVGPKSALSLLNLGPADQLVAAVVEDRVDYLSQAAGLGQKTAHRIVLDLKDKIIKVFDPAPAGPGPVPAADPALLALVNLGLKESEAQAVLATVDPKLPVDDRLRAALANLK